MSERTAPGEREARPQRRLPALCCSPGSPARPPQSPGAPLLPPFLHIAVRSQCSEAFVLCLLLIGKARQTSAGGQTAAQE